MARDDYSIVPRIEPGGPPDATFRIPTASEQFGGLIARGLGQFGAGVGEAADVWGQIQTDARALDTLKKGNDIVNNYRRLEGQAKIDAAKPTMNALRQLAEQGGNGLAPWQLTKYNNEVKPYLDRHWNDEIVSGDIQARHTVGKQVNQGLAEQADQMVVANPQDQSLFDRAWALKKKATEKQTELEGNASNPVIAQEQIRKAQADLYAVKIHTIGVTDPDAALAEANKPKVRRILGDAYPAIAGRYEHAAEHRQGGAMADQDAFASGAAPAGGTTAPIVSPSEAPKTPEEFETRFSTKEPKANPTGDYFQWMNPQRAPASKPRSDLGSQINLYRAEEPSEAQASPAMAAISSAIDVHHRAYDYFLSRGWTPVQAAGIVGGLRGETGNLNPTQTHDGGIGIGIAGWNGERRAELDRFASSNGLNPRDRATQLAFVDHELRNNESAAGALLRTARTPEEAAHAMVAYERPAHGEIERVRRGRYARQFYDQFAGGQ